MSRPHYLRRTNRKKMRFQNLALFGLFVFTFLSLLALLSVGSVQYAQPIQVGQVSPRTVRAERNLEILNQDATASARKLAASQVENIYVFDPAANQASEDHLNRIIQTIKLLKREHASKPAPNKTDLQERYPTDISKHSVEVLVKCSDEQLEQIRNEARNLLWRVMEEGVRSDRLSEARRNLRDTGDEMFRALPSDLSRAVMEMTSECLLPNRNPDFEATVGAQKAAAEAVKPIVKIIPEGAVLLREGEIVTAEHLRAVEAQGMDRSVVQYSKIGGYALLVLALMSLVLAFLIRERPDVATCPRHLLLLSTIFVGSAVVCRSLANISPYAVPVATVSILGTVLLEARLANWLTTCLAIFVGVLTQSLPATCVGLFAGSAGILALSKANHRSHLIAATVVVALVSACGAAIFSLLSGKNLQAMSQDVSFGALNGIISAALAVGLMPIFEYLFGITTHFRLLDISNPGEPLLQNLLKTAPGTYQHSILVANLAEASAQAIGANALLCKVGAYYHDIGKMKRPRFFVENQMGCENPHDRLAPSLSTTIIHSHVKDGIEMARQHKLPEVIIDFIAEHHGTSLVRYFYHQASNSGETVFEDDFRYPGPKPQSRETAILLLCDGVEAAARTMSSPTSEKLTELVNKMVQDHLDEGQLDESDLSLKDIQLIKESLSNSLRGIYHARIEYPEAATLRNSKKVTNIRKKA
jgi:putative nucleotidyltransferase with HDIG domain